MDFKACYVYNCCVLCINPISGKSGSLYHIGYGMDLVWYGILMVGVLTWKIPKQS